MTYEVLREPPRLEDYMRLRRVSGLSGFSEEGARKGLAATLFGVSILHEGQTVGMGRLIGDGGCFLQVVDIAVDPEHQGKGLGKQIMAALNQFIDEIKERPIYVSLIADVPANKLYEQFGFKETAPGSIGMARSLRS
ncbi:Ribosomal protein S18 acetylase RimI [Pseudovibrio denitrificans]|uniref:Ribosomal protein S18 acetylase RimI n=2 Tax=Pseudovibrio denitrificans TaxID=258256 RepID=A0A1I6XC38_9HYPH|nr:GNAT family N-acetyltransferase [Pseudovibrio denitrificans]SFT35879.1 Ribosomal protein S18 acetylase RimI [Pseudovibrio denitrificans]